MVKRNNPGASMVPMELCISKHESLAKEMGGMSAELKTIKDALVGTDLQSGLVKKISSIDSDIGIIKVNLKKSLSGKDKATIVVALLVAIASIIVAWLK